MLEKIKNKKIKPKPKWEFLLRDYLIWIAASLFLLIGSLAFSVVIFLIKNNDWEIYEQINDSLLKFILLTLPYFWLIFLALFVFLAYYNFKHTKQGYHYKVLVVVFASILVSLFLGLIFYNFGVGRAVDRALSNRIPFYSNFINRQRMIWEKPEEGRLSGVILSVHHEKDFEIKSLDGDVWNVSGEEMIILPDRELIKTGSKVKIIGQKKDENNFEAFLVVPFVPDKKSLKGRLEIRKQIKEHPEIFKQLKGSPEFPKNFRKFPGSKLQ